MNRRVLVVDDDDSIRNLVAEMAQSMGYETEIATNGVDALEKYRVLLETDPLLIVVSDMIMPRMRGDQLHEEVCKLADSRGLKRPYFIGMSGYDLTVEDYVESRESYARSTDFIQKPFKIDKLRKALERAETYLSE